MTLYEAYAPNGFRFTRKSERNYSFAIIGQARFGDNPDAWRLIGFSSTVKAAERTAKTWRGPSYGWSNVQVVPAKPVAPRAPRSTHEAVDAAGRTCTVRNAVTGECGKPAVHAFVASTGEVFAECADHKI